MNLKPQIAKIQDAPPIVGLAIILVALLLNGGDKPAASALLSLVVFLTTAGAFILTRGFEMKAWAMIPLVLWAALTGVHATMGHLSGGEHEYMMLLAGGCMFWIGRYGGQSRRRRARLMLGVASLVFAYALYGFLQHFLTPDYVLMVPKNYHLGRLSASFLSANSAATMFGLSGIFLGFRLMLAFQYDVRVGEKWSLARCFELALVMPLTCSGLMLCVTNIVLTGSRAGLMAASLGFLVLGLTSYIFGKRQNRSVAGLMRFFVVFGIIGAIVWSLSGGVMYERFVQIDGDLGSRQAIFEASLEAARNHPFFGHGLGSFNAATAFVATPETNLAIVFQNSAHNIFAQWYVQGGVFGVLGLVGLILAIAIRAALSHQDALIKGVQFGLLTCVLTHSLFDYALEIPAIFLFTSFLFGLLAANK